jgi:hypothetical protein
MINKYNIELNFNEKIEGQLKELGYKLNKKHLKLYEIRRKAIEVLKDNLHSKTLNDLKKELLNDIISKLIEIK